MILRILWYVLLFAAPFGLYAAYAAMRARRRAEKANWHETPWIRLAFVGAGLVIASLIWLSLSTGSEPGGRYNPARIENGRLVPGEVTRP